MQRLMIQETFTNEDKGYQFGDSSWYESYTDDLGSLFRYCQKDFGRCMSSVYVDTNEGTKKTGWYFESRQAYEDTGSYGRPVETYIRGVWVSYRWEEVNEEEAS